MDQGDMHRRRPDGAAPEADAADLEAIARDWITLWQSEMTAAAVDRELHETWQKLFALWASAAASLLGACPRGDDDGPAGAPRASVPPRPASAAAASDARDDAIAALARRLDALEQRLTQLENRRRGARARGTSR